MIDLDHPALVEMSRPSRSGFELTPGGRSDESARSLKLGCILDG